MAVPPLVFEEYLRNMHVAQLRWVRFSRVLREIHASECGLFRAWTWDFLPPNVRRAVPELLRDVDSLVPSGAA
jgi:hypothetical protein